MKKTAVLRSYLWVYLLIAFAVILCWTALFEALDNIKDNERLTISVYVESCDTQQIKSDLEQKLPELTSQEILELYVDSLSYDPENSRASTQLNVQILECDFAILPQSMLEEISPSLLFPALPESLLPDHPEDGFCIDGICYGLPLNGTAFCGYCDTEEICYLFLCSYSENLGGLLGRGETEDDAALAAISFLTEVKPQ